MTELVEQSKREHNTQDCEITKISEEEFQMIDLLIKKAENRKRKREQNLGCTNSVPNKIHKPNDFMSASTLLNSRVNPSLPLTKIISGGQTGADEGALLAARELGYNTGGYCTVGYVTSKGKNPALGTVFGLQEIETSTSKVSAMYIQRSKMNVDKSDGTIVFRLRSSPGTDKTVNYCLNKRWAALKSKVGVRGELTSDYKPVLVISDLNDVNNKKSIISFIKTHKIKTLNVAGHRDDSDEGEFTNNVKDVLIQALQ